MRATVASVVRAADVVAIGDLAGEALAAASGLVEEMHEAIADRPFGALGQAAGPVRAIHDGIAHTAYASVRTGLRAASRAGAAAAASRLGGDRPALAETRGGTVALAALNAVYGDRIADRGNGLALEMEIRGRGGGAALSPRIVVFIHGLGETERSWGYDERLQRDLGVSAVTLRYNTGLHISDNGRALARLLDELVAQWPCGVLELVLVGHSMGGLVARSACHYGDARPGSAGPSTSGTSSAWGRLTSAPTSRRAPTSSGGRCGGCPRPARSARWSTRAAPGSRTCGSAPALEEDWCDADADEFLTRPLPRGPVPARRRTTTSSRPRLPAARLGAVAGDLLVRVASASGRGEARRHVRSRRPTECS